MPCQLSRTFQSVNKLGAVPTSHRTVLVSSLITAVALGGCAELAGLPGAVGAGQLSPPSVTLEGVTLARSPGQGELLAYFCPQVVGIPLVCQGFFGRAPAPDQLSVAFDVRFKISNPNRMPLPLGSVLTAVTLFPGAGNQRLGAACMQLCPNGPGTCGDPANACQSSTHDVRSMSDFQGAAANLMISEGLALGSGGAPSFVAPQIAAAGDLEATGRFSFTPAELLAVLRQLADRSVDQLRSGQAITLSVPYRLEGTVWFDGGSLGRIAVPWGPLEGIWTIPTNAIR